MPLFAWFVLISAVTIGRYALYKAFIRRERTAADALRWENAFIAGVALAGLCWMAIGTALLPDVDRMVQRVSLVMLVMLLTTGAVAYYAPHRYAYKIVAFLGLVPLAMALALAGDRIHLFLSGFILILAIILPFVHARVHQALNDSLSVRRAKEMLTSQLATERGRLQEVNEALAEEMLERLKAQQSELVAAQKLRLHFERTPLAVIEWDRQHRITAWNPAAEAIFGFTVSDALGRPLPALLGTDEDREALQNMCGELLETREGNKNTLSNTTRSARTIYCEWYNTPLVDPVGKVIGFASLVQDITERLNTERTIHYMAHHDALTGLPNRRLMQDRLTQAIMAARRKQRHVAVSSSTSTASRW
jgi:PAS domain S-box-containing protein